MNSNIFLKQINKLMINTKFDWIRIKVDESMTNDVTIYVKSPKFSPYEGIHEIKLHFEEMFPYYLPKVTFVTKIWHPLINFYTGEVCNEYFIDNFSNNYTTFKQSKMSHTEKFLEIIINLLTYHKNLINTTTFIGINIDALTDIKDEVFEKKANNISLLYSHKNFP